VNVSAWGLPDATISLTNVSAPAAPTGLTATASNASVTLSWTASTGAASYKVYRRTSTSGESTIAPSVTSPPYPDTTAINGTTYYYMVAAVNSAGTSAPSAEVSATPEPPPPAPPTGLTATAGNASVTLSWTASTGAISYNVYRRTSTTGQTTIANGVNAPVYSDTTAINGVPYYYTVVAVNGGGSSAQSAEVSATPNPTIPTNLTISNPMTASTPCQARNTLTISGTVTITGHVTCTARQRIVILPGFTAVGSSDTTFTALIDPSLQ